MSNLRISRQPAQLNNDPPRRVPDKGADKGIGQPKTEVAKVRAAPPTSSDAESESYVSSIAAFRQPPKLSLATDFLIPKISITEVFSEELDSLEQRDAGEMAGILADVFLAHAQRAQKEPDGQILEAFGELGELMRGYEHLRLLQTGGLG